MAFTRRMEASAAAFVIPTSGPNYVEAEHGPLHAADVECREADEDAALDLTDVQPTTMAGVLALIDYVNDFNQGKFRLNDDWCSAPYNWPAASSFEFEGSEIDDDDNECGMAFAVLLNIRNALAAMAVQS